LAFSIDFLIHFPYNTLTLLRKCVLTSICICTYKIYHECCLHSQSLGYQTKLNNIGKYTNNKPKHNKHSKLTIIYLHLTTLGSGNKVAPIYSTNPRHHTGSIMMTSSEDTCGANAQRHNLTCVNSSSCVEDMLDILDMCMHNKSS